MNRNFSVVLLACLVAASVVVASPAGQAQAAFSHYFNFQQTTKPFIAQASQGAGTKLSRLPGESTCDPTLANYYARLASRPSNTVRPGARQATWMVAT